MLEIVPEMLHGTGIFTTKHLWVLVTLLMDAQIPGNFRVFHAKPHGEFSMCPSRPGCEKNVDNFSLDYELAPREVRW